MVLYNVVLRSQPNDIASCGFGAMFAEDLYGVRSSYIQLTMGEDEDTRDENAVIPRFMILDTFTTDDLQS